MIALEDFATSAAASSCPPQGGWTARCAQPASQQAAASAISKRRQRLALAFRAATDWFALCHALRRIGTCLKLHQGVLWVCDATSGRALISCATLGFDPEDLELRFGPLQPQRRAA